MILVNIFMLKIIFLKKLKLYLIMILENVLLFTIFEW